MFEILLLFGALSFLAFILIYFPFGTGEHGVSSKLEALRKRNNEYQPFNNVILKTPDGTMQIDHVVISPYGIFVIETKNFKGWIFGCENQKQWTQSLRRKYGFYSLFNQYTFQFKNPLHQNYKHVKAIQNFLGTDSCSIFSVVVFTGDAEFKTDMPKNVLGLQELIPYLKSYTERIFTDEIIKSFCEKLTCQLGAISESDHIRNIERNLTSPICPRCGKEMVLRTARKGSGTGTKFWGCPNFPSATFNREVQRSR